MSNASGISGQRGRAAQQQPTAGQRSELHRWGMIGLRYVLPTAVVLLGLAMMAGGSENDILGGAGVVSAGFAILLINVLFRIGAAGDRERDAEDAAREHFDKYGRWPD